MLLKGDKMDTLSILLLINSIFLVVLLEMKWNIFHVVSSTTTSALRKVLKKERS